MEKKNTNQAKVEHIIKELIKNAEALVDASKHSPSEQVLEQLQNKQEKLLRELREIEKDINGHIDISESLEKFGKLNREYIRNLANIHGVIYFQKNLGFGAAKTVEQSDKPQ